MKNGEHFENPRNVNACINYCRKEESRVAEPIEMGDDPTKRQKGKGGDRKSSEWILN